MENCDGGVRDERYNQLTITLKALSDHHKHHKETIEVIFYHLASVARESNENRMDTQSLAIVLAPCIIRYDYIIYITTVCFQMLVAVRVDKLTSSKIIENLRKS